MKKLRIHVVSLAIAGASAIAMPSFAMPHPARTDLGTPAHDGVPDIRSGARHADRVAEIGADTSYVNVTSGEVVKFVVGGNSFEWYFNTYGSSTVFDLKEIAPAGVLGNHAVKVYVSPAPQYLG